MPQIDGYQLMKEVRSLEQQKRTPIIVLTTETSESSKIKMKNCGASAWIAKPYEESVLHRVISGLLGKD